MSVTARDGEGAGVYRLSVLGPVMVRRPGAPVATSALTQSRHLALLVYLTLARPRGLQARAVVSDLLWPDQEATRARRGLRNALYGLRQVLGTDAVISVGEELVGLAPGVLACDALELERGDLQLSQSDLGTCTPFEGLRIDDAPSFMRWLEGERQRLLGLLRAPPSGVATYRGAARASTPHGLDPDVHYLRGHYLFLRAASGGAPADLEQSREHFERALSLDPGHALALAGMSNYLAVAARRGPYGTFHQTFARALEYARRAADRDHRLAIPHVHFAVSAQYLEGDWDRAGREFATAVAKEPDYAEGRRFYGVWLGQVGRHEAALAEMETAAMLEPDIPQILSSLGAARLAVGDLDGAERALRKTLAIDPNHRPARLRLVVLMEQAARWADATEERLRPPALPGSEAFVLTANSPDGYRAALRQEWEAEARGIETRLVEGGEPRTNDLFAPPVVRLVQLLTWLGEDQKVRAWRAQATAANPVMTRWLATVVSVPRT